METRSMHDLHHELLTSQREMTTRLATTRPEPATIQPGNPWHQATAATERILQHLTHGDEHTAQGQLVALGTPLDLLPVTAPTALKAELEQAATVFERATRSSIAADLDSTRVLRRSIQTIWRDRPRDRDGAGFATLLDAALTSLALAMHGHRTRQHAQQQAAAGQALVHLQIAYAQVSGPVLTGLAQRSPSPQTKRRFAHHLQEAVPEHGERILADPAGTHWPPCLPRRRPQDTTRPPSSTRRSDSAPCTMPAAPPVH
ncbi:hypothetical protein [Streptomyces sp. NPDC046727]|uniref:hypothetical protein n=1 Tax=Streptomyces sp. NPDC046727 TaxID=3155373 RepID=UPI00340B8D37